MTTDDPMVKCLRLLTEVNAAVMPIVMSFIDAPKDPDRDQLAWIVLLIEDVLADHHPVTSSHSRNKDQSLRVICHHDSPLPPGNFPDAQGWRDHVITIIRRRLQAVQALMNTDRTTP